VRRQRGIQREIQGREIQGGGSKRRLGHLLGDLGAQGGDETGGGGGHKGGGGNKRGRKVGGSGNGLRPPVAVLDALREIRGGSCGGGCDGGCDGGGDGSGGGGRVWQEIINPRRRGLMFVHVRQPAAFVDMLLVDLGLRRRSHIGGENGAGVPSSEEASFVHVNTGTVGEDCGVDTFDGWVVWRRLLRHPLRHRLCLAVRGSEGGGLLPLGQ
jgi:hypothetical protein